jgi:hypothetical protein
VKPTGSDLGEAVGTTGRSTYSRADLRLSDLPTILRILGLLSQILVLQHALSLPRLMRFFDVRPRRNSGSFEVDRVLWLTRGVLRRLFGARYCMKRSIILFRYLRRNRKDARIVFGVAKDGSELKGHAWVTIDGRPYAEEGTVERYAVTYSYPNSETTGQ